jgi:tetratricopeptide (TPR) repeat protein
MKGNVFKATLILAAFLLTIVIYFLPKTETSVTTAGADNSPLTASSYFEELEKRQTANLSEDKKSALALWKKQIEKNSSGNLVFFDSIASVWDEMKLFALSAYYFEQKATEDQTEKSTLNAAYRYFDAMKQAVDTSVKNLMTQKAIQAYQQVLEKNPANLNAKSDLGVLYAEGTHEPMKGITLLREVVAENPNHEMAQMNLGFLSLKSNQYEKAIERFDKVLAINPARIDMHIYKAQTYRQMNQNNNAVKELELFIASSDNKELVAEAVKLIEELKSGSPSHNQHP